MEPREYMEVDDIEVFEVLNNPVRVRILRQLMEPASVKQVAAKLKMPPTRLYYHIHLMEEAGLISVVKTRKAGAMIERLYQATARGFRPSPQLSKGGYEPSELAKVATGVVLDGARADAEESLTRHFRRVRDDEQEELHDGAFGRTVGFFTEEGAAEFADKLRRFIDDEFDPHDRSEGNEYGLTFVFFPLAGVHSEMPR